METGYGQTCQISRIRFKRDEIVQNYWEWYDGLGFADVKKKLIADNLLTPIINNLESANGEGTIEYKLLKEPEMEWNIILGGQYQLNKSWQFRFEGGIIGNRKSLLLSTNYRFGF